MTKTPLFEHISPQLHRVAKLAAEDSTRALLSLSHHIDLALLREAYDRTRKGGARGVNDPGSAVFAKDLEGNLQALLDRAKSGTYRAPPVRRTYFAEGERAAEPEGRREDQTAGHTDVPGQGASARNRDGSGGCV